MWVHSIKQIQRDVLRTPSLKTNMSGSEREVGRLIRIETMKHYLPCSFTLFEKFCFTFYAKTKHEPFIADSLSKTYNRGIPFFLYLFLTLKTA